MRALTIAIVVLVGCGSDKPRVGAGGGSGSATSTGSATGGDSTAAAGSGCPSSFSTAHGACDMKIRMACSYPDGTCTCSAPPWCGGTAPPRDYGEHTSWQCTPKVRADGCPGQEPSDGSSCDHEGQSCDYTCSCMEVARCDHGAWHAQAGPCKP